MTPPDQGKDGAVQARAELLAIASQKDNVRLNYQVLVRGEWRDLDQVVNQVCEQWDAARARIHELEAQEKDARAKGPNPLVGLEVSALRRRVQELEALLREATKNDGVVR